MNLVVILTDFGNRDPFVGVMKGVMLSLNSRIKFVDLTNEVTPFNIREAALILKTSYSYFPKGSIFLAVVDPGVGSERRALIVKSVERYFVGPDNGIFTPFFKGEWEAYSMPVKGGVSSTFHGRDIFAPAAAMLTLGKHPSELGDRISDPVTLYWPEPVIEGKIIRGEVLYIDRFGNLITNIEGELLNAGVDLVEIGGFKIVGLKTHYFEAERGELLALIGSSNYLEISVREGNAKGILKVNIGTPVKVILKQ
jgi:hypothetical protein